MLSQAIFEPKLSKVLFKLIMSSTLIKSKWNQSEKMALHVEILSYSTFRETHTRVRSSQRGATGGERVATIDQTTRHSTTKSYTLKYTPRHVIYVCLFFSLFKTTITSVHVLSYKCITYLLYLLENITRNI